MRMLKNFRQLSQFRSFIERYNYLKLVGKVGEDTFGFDRYLNQILYNSYEWKETRRQIIIRDDGNDLGCYDYPIQGIITVHHMNPITLDQVLNHDPIIFDPDFLISSSSITHRAIHFGDERLLPIIPEERRPNDTSPWRK